MPLHARTKFHEARFNIGYPDANLGPKLTNQARFFQMQKKIH